MEKPKIQITIKKTGYPYRYCVSLNIDNDIELKKLCDNEHINICRIVNDIQKECAYYQNKI